MTINDVELRMCDKNEENSTFMYSVDNDKLMYGTIKGMITFTQIKKEDNLIPDEECEICYENMKDCITECNHSFCMRCIKANMVHNTAQCPLCREKVLIVRTTNTD